MDTLDQNTSDEIALDTSFGMVSRYGAVLRMCDRAIVTNPFLARRVEAYVPHIETSIIPNFLNAEQQALSARLFRTKRQTGFVSNGLVHVGYFSGTPTHNRDFAVVTSALARLLSDNPQVVLRVVGFLEPKGALVPHRDRIETYPFQF